MLLFTFEMWKSREWSENENVYVQDVWPLFKKNVWFSDGQPGDQSKNGKTSKDRLNYHWANIAEPIKSVLLFCFDSAWNIVDFVGNNNFWKTCLKLTRKIEDMKRDSSIFRLHIFPSKVQQMSTGLSPKSIFSLTSCNRKNQHVFIVFYLGFFRF